MANPSEQFPNPVGIDLDITAKKGEKFSVEDGFTWLVRGFAFLTVAILFWMTWVVFTKAQPAIAKFGLGFFTSTTWDVPNEIFGALPYIYGTLFSSILSLLIAVPIGLAVALVTSEDIFPQKVRTPVAFIVELIAAIPSVVIGLWGFFVLSPFLRPAQQWLYDNFKVIPLFSTPPSDTNMLMAGIILGIMILPTMAAISRDVLLLVPKELRTGSMALGSTRWETIFRVILPSGLSGIVGAAMLALGRALGETMAVTLIIGNNPLISASLFDPGYTIPAVLAVEFAEATDFHISALMYLALILFALTLVVNIGAVLFVQSLGAKNR
ncbi:MAG: phosphate ABC transporter permease subunit PstC [Cyanomargarita calcarea GSE-NOS-MK-12-04C]|jgi:phosphate transport system permease protein|uniref:Phosphate transport system permease protein n=1 Tax=Cyanomargarita calcarea GSE-NOS-MK-12-04C TaxID=2839659 RepID=A0A951QWU3_9CYAN|nr:phosphate ABC transporter permease subunit PstC [Cyanomargarita calcarea GSE-NOS-MK-12-04C]